MTPDWRTLPSLAALRAFDATARHGGFSGAARVLNVTHAAVAQQVRLLERDLGMRLVQRLGRAVSLTAEGERLAATLSDGFGTIAQGIAALRRSQQHSGLRVATTPFVGQTLILPNLAAFWARHPGIEVALIPSNRSVDLVKEGFDLALRSWMTDEPGVEVIHLARSRWIVIGSPALLGDGPIDVTRLPWIWVADSDEDERLLRQAGLDTDALQKVVVGASHLETTAALHGLGLNLATEVVARGDIAAGRMREVPLPGLPEVNYYAVVPVSPRRPAIDVFVAWVRSLF